MDFKFEISGIEEAKKMISSKLLRDVLAKTVYEVCKDIKQAEIDEMKKVFDRPTPTTLNAIYIKTSKADLTGKVGIKDKFYTGIDYGYLSPQIQGGGRKMKKSEQYSRLGSYYTPAIPGVKLNQYGNIPGSEVTRILSEAKAMWEVGYMGNITERSRKRKKNPRQLFIIRVGQRSHLHPGVWERLGGTVRPLLFFVKQPQYKARLKFNEVAKKTLLGKAQQRFNEQIHIFI